jgi:hypothetical protein
MPWCIKKKTPEQCLFDIFQTLKIEPYKKKILQERYLSVLRNFHKRAISLGYMFYIARIIVTVGSVLVPAFLALWEQCSVGVGNIYWITWVISLSVTISNGILSLFKLDKKYFFINTTLEMMLSEGWQYAGLSGRYSGKDSEIPATHENQFLVFFHMAEKIKMRQVEEEYWKFTDTSGVGNATSQRLPFITPTPNAQITTFRGPQREAIERWVGDVKSNVLGLQPRTSNLSNMVDGSQGASGISRTTQETHVPMRPTVSKPTHAQAAVVQDAYDSEDSYTERPKNSFVQLMFDESDVWSGTKEESGGVEQESESEGES